jgi:hypothetical protein
MGLALSDARFFQRLGLAMALLTLLAFSTTYLLPLAAGRFEGPAILHIHGATFLAWPALFLAQAHSALRSRRWHRNLGFAGISLATAMVLTGLLAIGSSIESWTQRGVGLQGQAISIIAFTGLTMFGGFFLAAVAKIGDRATHSRLMALASLAIMQAVSGRLLLMILLGGNGDLVRPGMLPPVDVVRVMVPHLGLDLIVLAGMAWQDRKTLGHFHRVTMVGGAIVLLVHAGRHLLVETAAWQAVAKFLAAL